MEQIDYNEASVVIKTPHTPGTITSRTSASEKTHKKCVTFDNHRSKISVQVIGSNVVAKIVNRMKMVRTRSSETIENSVSRYISSQ